jgi:polyhydroxybutyrate depolymerase
LHEVKMRLALPIALRLLVLLPAAVGLLLPMATGPRAETATAAPLERTLRHAGVIRNYLMSAPPAARTGNAPVPVLVVLHGGGTRARMIMRHTRFNAIAAHSGFVALYPQGIGGHWNDARESAGNSNADDVGFVFAMLDDVERRGLAIDRAAVAMTGISNGGFMALRLACEAADRLAGIAAVTATMPDEVGKRCRPARPVAVMLINGTRDPLVPYGGGHVSVFGRNRGAIWSTERTVAFWAKVNGCSGAPRSVALEDRDPNDGSTTVRHDYAGCARAVTLLEVQGGGHTWPGGIQYLPSAMIGPVSRDFDASEAIAAFFRLTRSRPSR